MLFAVASAATAYHIAARPAARAGRMSMSSEWAGDLSAEVETAVAAVQRAMQLWCANPPGSAPERPRSPGLGLELTARVPLPPACSNALACDMEVADGDATSGKTMDACDTTAGATQHGQSPMQSPSVQEAQLLAPASQSVFLSATTTFLAGSPQPA